MRGAGRLDDDNMNKHVCYVGCWLPNAIQADLLS